MSKIITIPTKFGYPTADIFVNNQHYVFPSGVGIEVDDAVAGVIENAIALEPKENPYAGIGGGGITWNHFKRQGYGDVFYKLDFDYLADGLYRVAFYSVNNEMLYLDQGYRGGSAACIGCAIEIILKKQNGKFSVLRGTGTSYTSVTTKCNPLTDVDQIGLFTYDAAEDVDAYYSTEKIEV